MSELTIMEVNKLRNIQCTLEKTTNSLIAYLKKFPEYSDFIAEIEFTEDSNIEKDDLGVTVKSVLEAVQGKQNLFSDKNSLNLIDFKQFKREMIDIQDKIQNLRIQILRKMDKLIKESTELNEDVDFYSERILEWSEIVKINTFPNFDARKIKTVTQKHQCKEMREFMDFVHKNGGHENGWPKNDHLLFIKIRQKYKNIDIVSEKLHEMLPDLNTENIKKHEEWYKKYLRLKQRKKKAIAEWQESRRSKNINNDENKCIKIIANSSPIDDIQEKLKQWKMEKQNQLEFARQIERMKEQRRKEKEELQKKRNEDLKKIVSEWKQTKIDIERQEKLSKKNNEENDKRRRAAEANRMIKQFQSQDDMYVTKMMKQRKEKEIKLPVRSKSSQLAARDPKRLLKPTKQWLHRVKDEHVYDTPLIGIPLKYLPKLGVPEWRLPINNS